MKKRILLAALSLPVLLSGCVVSVGGDGEYDSDYHYSYKSLEKKNRAHIADFTTDMSISAVKSKMGVPDFNEMYQRGDDNVQVLFYRTQRNEGDGMTTKDECTPLVFKNGVLIGWGEHAYQKI